MCIVFYRVSKSDLWSYMVNTDLLPATPSSWVLSCVVFLLTDRHSGFRHSGFGRSGLDVRGLDVRG